MPSQGGPRFLLFLLYRHVSPLHMMPKVQQLTRMILRSRSRKEGRGIRLVDNARLRVSFWGDHFGVNWERS